MSMKFQLHLKTKMMKNKVFFFLYDVVFILLRMLKCQQLLATFMSKINFTLGPVEHKKIYNLRPRSLIYGHLIGKENSNGKENSIVVLIIAPSQISPAPYPVSFISDQKKWGWVGIPNGFKILKL